MRRLAHDTLPVQKHALVGEVFSDFTAGVRVMTSDGYPGRITAVLDGPFSNTESYEVVLDGGIGGGEYTSGQLRPLASHTAAEAAADDSMSAEAATLHLATEDYPELGTILHDRLPNERVKVYASRRTALTTDMPGQSSTPESGQMRKKDQAAEQLERAIPQVEQVEPPDACSFCGHDQFENPTNTGRGTRMECSQCGGTMTSWGGQWQPDPPSSPENAASRQGDPRATINDLSAVHAGQRELWNTLMGRAPDDDGNAPLREPTKVKHHVEPIDDRTYSVRDVDRANAEGGLDTALELERHKRHPEQAQFRLQHVPVDSLRSMRQTPSGRAVKGKPHTTREMVGDGDERDESEQERINGIRHGYDHNREHVPPIVVVKHGPHHVIVDGAHRAGVAIENGETHIPAFVTDHESKTAEGAYAPEDSGQNVMARYDLLGSGDPEARAVAVNPGADPRAFINHFAAREQPAYDPDLGFHLVATWADVRRKAKAIKDSGGVRILAATGAGVVGEVQGEHHLYEASYNYVPGTRKVADWGCGCKWGAYAWGRSPAYKRFEGRQCSHVTALQYEAQSRGMFGRQVSEDAQRLPGQHQRSPVTVQYDRAGDANLNRRTVPPGNMRRTFSQLEKTATDWAAFDSDHDYRSGHKAGAQGDYENHDHLMGRMEAGHQLEPHEVSYLAGHAAGVERARESASEKHRMKQVWDEHGVDHDMHHLNLDMNEQLGDNDPHEASRLDLAPVHAFACEMIRAKDDPDAILTMLAKHGVAQETALQITAWAASVVGDADGGSTQPGQDIPGLTTRDTTELKKKPHHHDHHTNDSRRRAPEFGRGIGWYAPGLMWCDQCNGSGCGHCGGTGQVMSGVAPTGGPGVGDLSTTTSPVGDNNPSAGEDTSGGVSAVSSLQLHQALLQQFTADYAVDSFGGGNPAQTYQAPTQHSNSVNPASTGWATSADPQGWIRPLINNNYGLMSTSASDHEANYFTLDYLREQGQQYLAEHPEEAKLAAAWQARVDAHQASAEGQSSLPEYTHAGLALKAADTGRVLMIQRSIKDESDPARGTWEFPGGGKEPGDKSSVHTGVREWEEEVGHPFPEGGHVSHTWRSGTYHGHVVTIPAESQIQFAAGRSTVNPDDPGGDDHEQSAWWHPADAKKNPALRQELKKNNPFGDIAKAASDQQDPNGPYEPCNSEECGGFPEGEHSNLDHITGEYGDVRGDVSNARSLVNDAFGGHEDDPGWLLDHQRIGPTKHSILNDEPEPALPSTDGGVEDDSVPEAGVMSWAPGDPAPGQYLAAQPEIPWGYEGGPSPAPLSSEASFDEVPLTELVAAFQATAAGQKLVAEAQGVDTSEGAQDENAQIAAMARAVLAGEVEVGENGISKSAMKEFSFAEQQELISEGATDGTRARNFDGLQIEGTHYALLGEGVPEEELWL